MNSTYYTYKHFLVKITDRNTYEKVKCLCGVPSNRKINEEHFNQLVERLIAEAYDKKPSPLGV